MADPHNAEAQKVLNKGRPSVRDNPFGVGPLSCFLGWVGFFFACLVLFHYGFIAFGIAALAGVVICFGFCLTGLGPLQLSQRLKFDRCLQLGGIKTVPLQIDETYKSHVAKSDDLSSVSLEKVLDEYSLWLWPLVTTIGRLQDSKTSSENNPRTRELASKCMATIATDLRSKQTLELESMLPELELFQAELERLQQKHNSSTTENTSAAT